MSPTIVRRFVVLGAPLALVIVELIHPVAYDPETPIMFEQLAPQRYVWIATHLLELVLFGMMGVAVHLLLRGARGLTATLSRLGMGVFVTLSSAMAGIVGIAVGLLIHHGAGLTGADRAAVAEATQLLFAAVEWDSWRVFGVIPEVGWVIGVLGAAIVLSRPRWPAVSMAVAVATGLMLAAVEPRITTPLGVMGVIAAVLAAAGPQRDRQVRRTPLVLLGLAAALLPFGHFAPFGPLAFGYFAMAAAYLEWRQPAAPPAAR